MSVRKWFHKASRVIRGSLRFRLFLLILLFIIIGNLLVIYSIITQPRHDVLAAFVIAFIFVMAVWNAGDILILRSLNSIIKLSKKLASGDLTARSTSADSFGLFGELAQSLDRIATTLEEKTEK